MFQRTLARDFAFLRCLLALDTLDRDLRFLGDARGLDRLARRDLGFVGRLVAGDLQCPDPLFLCDPGGFGHFSCRDAGFVERFLAFDLQGACCLLRGNPVGGEFLLPGDPGRLGRLLRGDLGLFERLGSGDLQIAGLLVGFDPLRIDHHLLGDAQFLRRLARRDLGLFNRLVAGDLAAFGLFLVFNAGLGDRAFLFDARLLGRLARGDVGLLDRTPALDLAPLGLFLVGDAGFGDLTLLNDPRRLDLLARRDLGCFHGLRTLDFALADFLFRCDARLGNRVLVGDAGLFHLLARDVLGLLGLGLALGALPGDFGALGGALGFDLALLFEPGGLALAFDVERLLFGLQIARTDLDHRLLFDVVALLALGFDVLDQPGQTFGVELIGRVEEFKVGLVDVGDGEGFELQTVLRQRFGGGVADPPDIVAALFVHLVKGHFRGDRAQRRDELAVEERVQPILLHGPASERRGGNRDRLVGRRNANVELRIDVQPSYDPWL